MNGLEEIYGGQIAFQRVDANSPDGQIAFRAYRLQGHPAYAVLDPEGKVLWTGLGEQPGEKIGQQLDTILAEP